MIPDSLKHGSVSKTEACAILQPLDPGHGHIGPKSCVFLKTHIDACRRDLIISKELFSKFCSAFFRNINTFAFFYRPCSPHGLFHCIVKICGPSPEEFFIGNRQAVNSRREYVMSKRNFLRILLSEKTVSSRVKNCFVSC